MTGQEHHPSIPMDRVLADELEVIGSHGMQAYRYPEMMAMIEQQKLMPEKLLGKQISLEQSLVELVRMSQFSNAGVTVINQF
jgi:alcohol dehydrogenase